MITVEGTDFVSVPVTDLERPTRCYADTLGLPQTGHLLDPTNIGQQFRGPHTSAIALRRRYAAAS